MRADSPRWHEVSKSEFPHERAGLAHVRELLPDRAPFQAWSNFEFRDRQGKWHEVDLLVLGESRLHLVELKHLSIPSFRRDLFYAAWHLWPLWLRASMMIRS
ncbi:NERD domain-containing protein, partial [Streptomyces sp. NPDC048342]|uniref:NERD domain-containing protein n=1 Tax=unclassified Streptomyces TaxID=2593676 RepID=UPI0034165ACA